VPTTAPRPANRLQAGQGRNPRHPPGDPGRIHLGARVLVGGGTEKKAGKKSKKKLKKKPKGRAREAA